MKIAFSTDNRNEVFGENFLFLQFYYNASLAVMLDQTKIKEIKNE